MDVIVIFSITWLIRMIIGISDAGHLESKDLLASVGEAVSEMLEATGQITDIQQHSKEIRLGPPGGYWGELVRIMQNIRKQATTAFLHRYPN